MMDRIASSPLPALAPCDEAHFLQAMRILWAALPKRPTDKLSGKLMIEGYKLKLMHLPREAIDFLVSEALSSRFFPSIAECEEISVRWKRSDGLVKATAIAKARTERQTRQDQMMRRLDRCDVRQEEFDALPERIKLIAEARGLVRDNGQGGYLVRTAAELVDQLPPAEALSLALSAFPVSPERRNAA